jgi:hypothetical protein
MSSADHLLWQLLFQVVVVLVLVFASVGVALGVGLIVASARVLGLFAVVNRWVSTRGTFKALEVQRSSELLSHRYRLWIGCALIAGGLFAAIGLVARMDPAAVGVTFARGDMATVLAVAAGTVKWFLVVGSVAGVAVGVLLFFPGALARVEGLANRWISTRRIARRADEAHLGLDRLVEAHPGPAGWILACTSLGAAIYAVVLLSTRA